MFIGVLYLCFGRVLLLIQGTDAQPQTGNCMCVQRIGNELLFDPVVLESANDGSNRLFVAEEAGRIHIYYPDGSSLSELFLDISDEVANHTDRIYGKLPNILGMVFHPKFQTNGLFYLYYRAAVDDSTGKSRHTLGEFKVLESDENKADPEYFRLILNVYQPYILHAGGQLFFGTDSYLYMFLGDGSSNGDRHGTAQNMELLNGKVLRIDVDNPTEQANYSIPADNPFLEPLSSGVIARPEIYAYGLRNPWRCGMDTGNRLTGAGKGRIICGDVGENKWEELDVIEKGANYGWNNWEGSHLYCSKCKKGIPSKKPVDPIHDYKHSKKTGTAVIGGHFYRGCRIPYLDGFFVYGDFTSGKLFRISESSPGSWKNEEITMCGSDLCNGPLSNKYNQHIFSFGKDEDGEIYFLSSDNLKPGKGQGRIYRLVDPLSTNASESCKESEPKTMPSITMVGSNMEIKKTNETVETTGQSSVTTFVVGSEPTGHQSTTMIVGSTLATHGASKDSQKTAQSSLSPVLVGSESTGQQVTTIVSSTFVTSGTTEENQTTEHSSVLPIVAGSEPTSQQRTVTGPMMDSQTIVTGMTTEESQSTVQTSVSPTVVGSEPISPQSTTTGSVIVRSALVTGGTTEESQPKVQYAVSPTVAGSEAGNQQSTTTGSVIVTSTLAAAEPSKESQTTLQSSILPVVVGSEQSKQQSTTTRPLIFSSTLGTDGTTENSHTTVQFSVIPIVTEPERSNQQSTTREPLNITVDSTFAKGGTTEVSQTTAQISVEPATSGSELSNQPSTTAVTTATMPAEEVEQTITPPIGDPTTQTSALTFEVLELGFF